MRPPLLLLAALALGCGHAAPRPLPAASPSLADHPEIAACRAVPGACHGSAWRALRGESDLPGDWAAAAFLMAGCEGGHAQSCADLGELYAAGRGVPVDHGRACELGRTASCAKAGRSPPFVGATPTGPLPSPRPPPPVAPPSPQDAEAYGGWAGSLYGDVLAPLGLTREALAATPPAPPAERALLGLLIARRMQAVRACLPAEATASAPSGRTPLSAVAAFTVGADGKPVAPAVRSVQVPHWPLSSEWDRCAEAAIASWTLPLVPSGRRFWLTFTGAGEPVPSELGAKGAPVWAAAGWRKPAVREPGCVVSHVALPYRLTGFVSGPITVRFSVEPDGRPRWFAVVTERVPGAVAEAIWNGVRACEWTPGADPEGKPASVWVVLPFKFSAGE